MVGTAEAEDLSGANWLALLAAGLDALGIGLGLVDAEGGFRPLNETAGLLGDEEGGILESLDLAGSTRRSPEGDRFEVFARPPVRPDGAWLQILVRPIPAAHGASAAALVLVRDATEVQASRAEAIETRRALEAARAELEAKHQQLVWMARLRSLGEMASGITHEFNNLLLPILGFSEMLLEHPEDLDRRDTLLRYLRMVNTAAKEAAKATRRMRSLYRREPAAEASAPVDLRQTAELALMLTEPRWKDQALAEGASIRIEKDLAPVPPVLGDATGIQEALVNLVFNAVDAMPRGGVLRVRTAEERAEGADAPTVVVELADTGTGMSAETLARCREPFFSTKGEAGTGLGLALVEDIVRRSGGTLEIESAPRAGTTVRLRWPAARAGLPEETAASPRRAGRPRALLVVDDDPVVREVLVQYLAREGHRVVTASNGREGLEQFHAGWYDAVLTDQAMPEMSGAELARAIKRAAPTKPVILLTGLADALAENEAVTGTVDLLLAKPITPAALLEAVERVTGERPSDDETR